jgi:hypothetical protein
MLGAPSDDQYCVDAPSSLLLSFIFAAVVGYFIGRTTSIGGRSSSDRR